MTYLYSIGTSWKQNSTRQQTYISQKKKKKKTTDNNQIILHITISFIGLPDIKHSRSKLLKIEKGNFVNI